MFIDLHIDDKSNENSNFHNWNFAITKKAAP